MRLTPRQTEALAFVVAFRSDHGYPPTVRELAKHLGVRYATAREHLEALEKRGAIARAPGIPRGIRVLADPTMRTGHSNSGS